MVSAQGSRGPDASKSWQSPRGGAGLGHNRLSILDLSEAGVQPMCDPSGRYWIVFNGEIYNYKELRTELGEARGWRTGTDTEVLLASYLEWGEQCLDRLTGMFAFVVWDEQEQRAFGARDRFGVKPLHLHQTCDGELWVASEIKAFHAAGLRPEPDAVCWASYLTSGMHDHSERTFWEGVTRLAPGGTFRWSREGGLTLGIWYDLAERMRGWTPDERGDDEVADELLALLEDSIRLRFRSDVPVGVCLSGGLDSSLLLGLVHRIQGAESSVKTFTFHCGDDRYDELPWVRQMLEGTRHPACFCLLSPSEIPELAARVQRAQDEPYGGFPTLGMAKVHERAAAEGVVVLLDGNGLDEGWAGYEYYGRADKIKGTQAPVQGASGRVTRPECLSPEFAALAEELRMASLLPGDSLARLQYRDIRHAKIPRAMRFADRVSMMFSRELREPFLDHRILELGLRQPAHRKIRDGQGKWLVRRLAARLLPRGVREAPKRPVQTPQREWLRGPLAGWAEAQVGAALESRPDWFLGDACRRELRSYLSGDGDSSFHIWQWISAGMILAPGSSPLRNPI